jgi:hypothetical protein
LATCFSRKKPSSGQNGKNSSYNEGVHFQLEFFPFWPDDGFLQPKHVAKILNIFKLLIYMLCF